MEETYGLKLKQLKDIRDKVIDASTIKGEGVPSEIAKVGSFYLDTKDNGLYFSNGDGWELVESEPKVENYGSISFYSEYSKTYSVNYSSECEVTNIDTEILTSFLAEYPPSSETSIDFSFEGPSMEWLYYSGSDEVRIAEEDFTSTTGITVQRSGEWSGFSLTVSWDVDTSSTKLSGLLLTKEAVNSLSFQNATASTGENIYIESTGEYVDVPGAAIYSVVIRGRANKIDLPNYFMAYCAQLEIAQIYDVNTIGNTAFRGCTNLVTLSGNTSVKKIGDNFCQGCTKLNASIPFTQVEEIGSHFLYGCTKYDKQITFNECTKIGMFFLGGCSMLDRKVQLNKVSDIPSYFMIDCVAFNSDLDIAGVKTIDSSFLYNCQAFNKPLELSGARLLGGPFMRDCKAFNRDITLPRIKGTSVTSVMQNCNAMVGTVNIGDIPATVIPPNSKGGWFTTDNSSAACYTTGITIKGDYADDWLTALPDSSTSPYRKLIKGGGTGPNVVQATGTSTTDVMSQNAVTSMVFADPNTKQKVQIGNSASANGAYGVALGYSSNAPLDTGISVGYQASAGGIGAVALGRQAQTSSGNRGSIALGSYSNATQVGEMNIGSSETNHGYNNSNYRLLTGLYDGQGAHDAVTKGQLDTAIINGGTTAPTTSTVGAVGTLYIYVDTTGQTPEAHLMVCTAVSGSTYTWTDLLSGIATALQTLNQGTGA